MLVQANFGRAHQLRDRRRPGGPGDSDGPGGQRGDAEARGSIIIVVATDAPLLPHQLKRLARRATLGLARTGSMPGNGSGDIFLAFSTANPRRGRSGDGRRRCTMLPNGAMDPLFDATVQATEEAIVNALVAAETMTGASGITVRALPHDELRRALEKHNRLAK